MTATDRAPLTWAPFPKRRPGRPANTASHVLLLATGQLDLPTAVCDALGLWDRVHLFVATDQPGYLWLCPAFDDDADAYRLSLPTHGGGTRRVTAADLPERLGVDPDADIVRGDWLVMDDRIVVVFPVDGQP